MKKKIIPFTLILFMLIGGIGIWQYPKLNLISGFAAKSTASTIYIANCREGFLT